MLTIFQQIRFFRPRQLLSKYFAMKRDYVYVRCTTDNYLNQSDICIITHVRWLSLARVEKFYLANSKESHHKMDVTGHRFTPCASCRRSSSYIREWYQTPGINMPFQEDLQEDGVLLKYLTPCNLHSQGQELLENITKWPRTSQQQPKNTAHRAVFRKDTEISTCDWPSYKITLPGIQGDIICFGRPAMTKSCNGFSNIFQFCNMQKILNPIFCEEQKVRSLSTQTKQAQQKEVKKEEHYAPSQSDSLSNSTSLLTRGQKLQKAVKEYGSTVMVFHVTISLISLGTFYLAVSSGIDMGNIMSYFDVGDNIQQSQVVAGASTFVVAYAIHKVFAPVRIGITLSATPFIVRYLRLKGILKP